MTTTISGTTGIVVPTGSSSAPSEAGSLATTAGIFYPAANVVAISTNSADFQNILSSFSNNSQ